MLMAKIQMNKYINGTFIDKYDDYYIKQYMQKITNDPEKSAEAAAWAVDADEGDIYTFREGYIKIIDDGLEEE